MYWLTLLYIPFFFKLQRRLRILYKYDTTKNCTNIIKNHLHVLWINNNMVNHEIMFAFKLIPSIPYKLVVVGILEKTESPTTIYIAIT